jgi:phosphohistidine phosphatase
MNLILWRHADAEDLSERRAAHATDDLARALTGRGRKQAERGASWLKHHLGKELEKDLAILVSPALRTRQTAAALAADYTVCQGLAPGADVAEVLAAAGWPAGRSGRNATIIVVGHHPTLGRVASLLLSGGEADWRIRKGGIWWLCNRQRAERRQIILRAVVDPDLA